MSNFIDRMFGRNPKGSGATAKERLQIVLVHDRINLPPERIRAMKEEILAVISKYVPVDHDSVDISLEQRDRTSSRIRAEIPFTATIRMSDPDEDVDDSVTARTSSDAKPTSDKVSTPDFLSKLSGDADATQQSSASASDTSQPKDGDA